MKIRSIIVVLTLAFLMPSVCFAQGSQKSKAKNQSFFTVTDASNWIYIVKDKTLNPSEIFNMSDGVLHISGISSGYLRTRKSYSNYELNLEWRWVNKFGNSGVLIHIQPKDTIWPVCYQVQQKADAAGDIICMNGLWAKECTDSVRFTVNKLVSSNEKPLGEWNSMKVICRRNTLKVFVNGVLQNRITGLTAKKGFIGFQNEGTAMEFKNIAIH